jgi:DNA polymerase-3 subunit alpha
VVPLEEWKNQPAERPAPKAAPAPAHRQSAPQLTDAQLAQQAKRKLFVKLGRPMMDRVTTLLSLHPGSVPVYLHIPEEKITLLAPRLNWCDATEDCLKRLKTFLGEENVKLTEAK